MPNDSLLSGNVLLFSFPVRKRSCMGEYYENSVGDVMRNRKWILLRRRKKKAKKWKRVSSDSKLCLLCLSQTPHAILYELSRDREKRQARRRQKSPCIWGSICIEKKEAAAFPQVVFPKDMLQAYTRQAFCLINTNLSLLVTSCSVQSSPGFVTGARESAADCFHNQEECVREIRRKLKWL